jgi:hypothetical protein
MNCHLKENNMKSLGQWSSAILAISILVFGLSACEKKEGPAERAGKEVDKTVEKAGQSIQDAAKDAKK